MTRFGQRFGQRLPTALAVLIALALLVGVPGAASVTRTSAQDAPDNALLNEVVRFLSARLNRPVRVVENYSYEALSFEDSALGCPEAEQTYKPGPFSGYKFLLTIQGITYDVRATLDAAYIVLCSGSEIRQQVGLSTYRSPTYSISYPNTWNATDRGTDVYFGLGLGPVCAEPGMIVTPLGPAEGRLPPDMLTAYMSSQSRATVEVEQTRIRAIGLSQIYTAPCADGRPRKTRVTMFVAYGRAFRVLQFAPQDAFGQWADVFLAILNDFGPTAAGTGAGGQAITLPDVSPLAAIAHIFGGNVYLGALSDLPGRPITTGATADRPYHAVALSPDGALIAFVDPNQRAVYIAPREGGSPRKLAEGVVTDYTPIWSPEGREIIYMAAPADPAGGQFALMRAPVDGSAPIKVADLPDVKVDCAAPTSDPADRLYWSETGPNGNPLWLYTDASGAIYYAANCGVDVAVNTDGANQILLADLRRARFSPLGDGKLIGLTGDAAVLVNASDGTRVRLNTAGTPDQLAWSADGQALYYSLTVPREKQILDNTPDAERGAAVFGVWPVELTIYEVSLHRLDLFTGEDIELFKSEGRGIGRIAPSPDGAGVLFTFVSSAERLVEAFGNNVSDRELRRQGPTVQLYWLASGGVPQLVALSSAPAWGALGSALAPTATASSNRTPTPRGFRPSPTPTRTPTSPPPTPTLPPTLTPTIAPTSGDGAARPTRIAPPTNTPRPTSTQVG